MRQGCSYHGVLFVGCRSCEAVPVNRVVLYAQALGVEAPEDDMLAAMIAATVKRIKASQAQRLPCPTSSTYPAWSVNLIKQHLEGA